MTPRKRSVDVKTPLRKTRKTRTGKGQAKATRSARRSSPSGSGKGGRIRTRGWHCPICKQKVRIPMEITVISAVCDGGGHHRQTPLQLQGVKYGS